MTFKHFAVTAFVTITTSLAASAQDRITLRGGETIRAKVKEVSTRTITYKRWDNQEGPDFIIDKNKVQTIKYANGSVDEVDDADMDSDEDRRGRRDRYDRRDRDDAPRHRFGLSREKYGKNILSLAPIQMANESAAGVGLQYERVLDKKSMVSLVLPFAIQFYNVSNNGYRDTRTFQYFYPGIKVYPTGSNRVVSYGIGVAAAMGFGNKYLYDYTNNNGNGVYRDQNVFKAGLLINNSLNMQPTKNLYLGLELGLGFTYYNNENDYDYYGYNSGTFNDGPLVQFSFKIGYRF